MRRLFFTAGLTVCSLHSSLAATVCETCELKYPVTVNYSTKVNSANLDIELKISFDYTNGLVCEDFSLPQTSNYRFERNRSCTDIVSGKNINGETVLTAADHTKYVFDRPSIPDLRQAFIIYDFACNEKATRSPTPKIPLVKQLQPSQ